MSQELDSNIYERVREKKESYRRYNFERLQEEAFATFFDLAQEYTSLESLCQIAVAVPREFLNLESVLHIINPKTSKLERVCGSEEGLIPGQKREVSALSMGDDPYETQDAYIFPIRGNTSLSKLIPFYKGSHILGMFEVRPKEKVDEKNRFFLEKFANRIGYNLHQKLLIQQNFDHIKFINQLVSDIEHNVISPNMYYKLFLLRLKKNLQGYDRARQQLRDGILFLHNQNNPASKGLCEIYKTLDETNQALSEEWKALSKHYQHTSMFLETLFRKDHFEKGAYVLRKQSCNFRTEIIEPLLERYLPMLAKREIAVDNSLENDQDEQITLFVDKGLISQVFDNLFSNAVKYAQQVEDQWGNKIKLLSYDRKILRDFFGEGVHGMRFSFFTTGPPLSAEDASRIFEEGYRAASAGKASGSGHGLHFVRNVVEIHGGAVGCEPQRYGNLIFFTLPMTEPRQMNEG